MYCNITMHTMINTFSILRVTTNCLPNCDDVENERFRSLWSKTLRTSVEHHLQSAEDEGWLLRYSSYDICRSQGFSFHLPNMSPIEDINGIYAVDYIKNKVVFSRTIINIGSKWGWVDLRDGINNMVIVTKSTMYDSFNECVTSWYVIDLSKRIIPKK